MKRTFAVVLVIFLGAILISAQGSLALRFLKWKHYQPENEEFSVETPIDLRSIGGSGPKVSRKYFASTGKTYLYVFSDPTSSPDFAKVVARFASASEKSLETGESSPKTQQISFLDHFGYWQNIVISRSETRIYTAQSVSESQDDEIAKRFIKSFVTGQDPVATVEKPEVTPSENPTAPDSETPVALMAPSLRSGSGSGTTGTGQGNGIGAGNDTQRISPTPPNTGVTSPVKILSKERPAYTDLARIYEISGSVMTRVTFLASGQIGAVTPVTKLPFGLTEQAVAAAKKITFEPALLNGAAVNIIKQVEYSFLIY